MYGTVYDVRCPLERVRSAANMSLSCEDCVIWTPRQSPAAPRRDPAHVRLTAGHTEAYKVNTPVYTPRTRGDRPRGRARARSDKLLPTDPPARPLRLRPSAPPTRGGRAHPLSALGPPARFPHKFLTTNELAHESPHSRYSSPADRRAAVEAPTREVSREKSISPYYVL